KDFFNKSKLLSTNVRKDLLQRAAAFLLLKDSKASFNIEGEKPKSNRAARWGRAIGQAGAIDISKDELLRLQQIVIESDRFITHGFRQEGGFVGEHDRATSEPVPSHISAKYEDLDELINGLIETTDLLLNSGFDAVLAAAIIAFAFVFIHPFEDGNGRIHRYLIHHILSRKNYFQQGLVFPISASILDHIDDYRRTLEKYSLPLLDFVDWRETKKHNVEILNDTIDFYRYFDLTKQAEFLFDCVNDTIENIIPEEIKYLENYEDLKLYLDDKYEMTDKTIALLIQFLERNNGILSKRAVTKEFAVLSDNEIKDIENKFKTLNL
ncbi:MAG: cell filamentation protein Fic, partial [Chlamydiae bacterium]